jgi:NAD-dependent dihydropyrimidine dehydrogenase PreA subunit
MPVKVDVQKCNGCKSCEQVCPVESIKVPANVAVVAPEDCIDCNA